jgi:hypothetical protein
MWPARGHMTHLECHWNIILIYIKNRYSDTGKCVQFIPFNPDEWNTKVPPTTTTRTQRNGAKFK